MPFIFSFRIKFKVCFIFCEIRLQKNSGPLHQSVLFRLYSSYLFKEKAHNIYLIDFIFLPFPIYNVTYSGKDGLGGTWGNMNSSGSSAIYPGSVSSA